MPYIPLFPFPHSTLSLQWQVLIVSRLLSLVLCVSLLLRMCLCHFSVFAIIVAFHLASASIDCSPSVTFDAKDSCVAVSCVSFVLTPVSFHRHHSYSVHEQFILMSSYGWHCLLGYALCVLTPILTLIIRNNNH